MIYKYLYLKYGIIFGINLATINLVVLSLFKKKIKPPDNSDGNILFEINN